MSKKTIIIIIIGLLLLCCCSVSAIGAFVLIFSDDKIDDIKDKIEEEVESVEDDVNTDTNTDTDTNADADADNDDSDPDNLEETNDSLTYSNADYDFSLQLEKGWEKYKVEETLDTTDSFVATYSFELKDSYGDYISLFTIGVYTSEQWTLLEDFGIPEWTGEEKIGESSTYIYTFTHLNGFVPTELEDEYANLDKIKGSFEIVGNK